MNKDYIWAMYKNEKIVAYANSKKGVITDYAKKTTIQTGYCSIVKNWKDMKSEGCTIHKIGIINLPTNPS